MERTYTIKNSDYGYPVTLDEKGKVIDDELITDLPDVEIAFIVDFVSRLGSINRKNGRTGRTSYGLKHVVERCVGLYTCNNQFKSLFVLLGQDPVNAIDYATLNWGCYFSEKLVQKFDTSYGNQHYKDKQYKAIYGVYRKHYFYKYRDNMKKLPKTVKNKRWSDFFQKHSYSLVTKSKAYIKKLNENIAEYGVEKAINLMPSLLDIDITDQTETDIELTTFDMAFNAIGNKRI